MSSLTKNRASKVSLQLIALFLAAASFVRPCPLSAAHAALGDASLSFDRDRCDCQVADHSEIVGADGNPVSVGLDISTPDVDSLGDVPGSRPLAIPRGGAADRCAP